MIFEVKEKNTLNGQLGVGVEYYRGENGKSAYEIALDNGFEGTEQEWLESLATGGVDLSNYYTKTETDSAIESAVAAIPKTDLTNYYNKAEVDGLIPDTSGFALKTDIPDTSGFTTMAAVEEKGYQTEDDVNALINSALGVIENGAY